MERVYKNLFIIELLIILLVSYTTYIVSSKFYLFDYIKPLINSLNEDTVNRISTVVFSVVIFMILITFNRIYIFIKRIKKYKKLSLVDDLTKLYNRRHIEILLNNYIEKETRYNTPFSVILFDLDFFKKINDTYGHLEGDYVLKTISHFLEINTRNSDVVGRWGGEEFIVICSNTNLENAENFANSLRIGISKLNIHSHINVTASFGIAQYNKTLDNTDKVNLIKRVDKALYSAKNHGRNRVSSSISKT